MTEFENTSALNKLSVKKQNKKGGWGAELTLGGKVQTTVHLVRCTAPFVQEGGLRAGLGLDTFHLS